MAGTILFNAETAEQRENVVSYIQKHVNAPYVKAGIMTLGGVERASAAIHLSLDPKSTWVNGIFHNSRYMIMFIHRDGSMELTSKGYKTDVKFRKQGAKTLPMAVAKINALIQAAK